MFRVKKYDEKIMRKMRKKRTKKRIVLGQHFLKTRWAARMLVRESGAKRGETVLEIGPGTGILTQELLHTDAKIIAIEKDSSLVERLCKKFAKEIENGQLKLIKSDIRDVNIAELIETVNVVHDGDIVPRGNKPRDNNGTRSARSNARHSRALLKYIGSSARKYKSSLCFAFLFLSHYITNKQKANRIDIYDKCHLDVSDKKMFQPCDSYILAANIPYYITGEIIRAFLTADMQPKQMALLVQKEVAERIAKSKKESILSLSVKAYGTPRYVKKVSRICFSPVPKVDSAILSIENISKNFFDDVDEKTFFNILKTGFASKRKLLISNMSVKYEKPKVFQALSTCDIPDRARAEEVGLKKWKCLTKQLTKASQ